MSTLLVHLPAGFLRWKQLRDQPLLTGLPYQVLTVLLDPENTRDDWTQEAVARRLGATMHAVRKAFATLRKWGYWQPRKRIVGRARVLHWWCVTDEAGEFGDAEARIVASYNQACSNLQVTSAVDQQQVKTDTEPPSSSGESSGSTPQPPIGDNSSGSGRRTWIGRLRRRQRSSQRLVAPALPAELQPWALQAIKLAHDLGVKPHRRQEASALLAYLLATGRSERELLWELSRNMKNARDVSAVAIYRARKQVEAHTDGSAA